PRRSSALSGNVTMRHVNVEIDDTPPVAVVTGAPTAPTRNDHATLTVSGTDVAAYRYRLDSGSWSDDIDPSAPIALTDLPDGTRLLEVIGADDLGNLQVTPTQASWTVDTTPPTAVLSG